MKDPRQPDEVRFEDLLAEAERGRLGFAALRELARLYRIHTSRLSQVRHSGFDPERVRSLNALCVRAYGYVYVEPPRGKRPFALWLTAVPAALGRSRNHQLLAAALLALGAVLGSHLVLEDPGNLSAVVPASLYDEAALERLYNSAEARTEFLSRSATSGAQNTLFASSLFANNTRVGLLSLAAGVFGAVPSLLLLVYNGLTLGGFATLFLRGPESMLFIAWILPHAVTELLAIVLCSAGGLGLGFAVLAPGRAGRAHALRAASGDALRLFLASVPLFVAAALIESFVRESQLSTPTRFGVAALSVATLVGYVLLVRGLARRRARPDLGFLRAGLAHTNPASRIAK